MYRRAEPVADEPAKPSPPDKNNLSSHLVSQVVAWAGQQVWVSCWSGFVVPLQVNCNKWWCGQLGQAPSSLSLSFNPLPGVALLD